MTSEPFRLTVAEAARRIARRELSPVELVRSLMSRIDALEPELQAWERVDREGALAVARECEARPEEAAGKPLWGVPFGIKDIFYTAGLRTAAGFPPWDRFVPAYDAAAVARLRAAGAIILGKTVTTQFAMSDPARTRNPWSLDRTPGGSSSGSAAAVGAAQVPAALGSQTFGSGLRPAAYCGVVGLKPSYGVVSRFGMVPISSSLDHVAIIARTVEDAALVLDAIAGSDPRDAGSVAAPWTSTSDTLGRLERPPRLGLLRDFVDRSQPEVAARCREVATALSRQGAEVTTLSLPIAFETVLAVHALIIRVEGAAVHRDLYARFAQHYAPMVRAATESGLLIPAAAYLHAQRLRRRIRVEVRALLSEVDCLLAPTAPNRVPDPSTTGDASFQAMSSLLGLPAVSVPAGRDSDGLPLGVQLIGRSLDDARVLRVAHWCESRLRDLTTTPPPASPGAT